MGKRAETTGTAWTGTSSLVEATAVEASAVVTVAEVDDGSEVTMTKLRRTDATVTVTVTALHMTFATTAMSHSRAAFLAGP